MTSPVESPPSDEVRDTRRYLLAAGVAALITGVSLGVQIALRTPLAMDELHSVLLGKLWGDGVPPSFYVGSVTRYEGGSYLIAIPVGILLRLGVWGTAAGSWAAAAFAILTVFLSSFWLARLRGSVAAIALGVGFALLSPEVLHYAFRAWGSISESLLLWPILALVARRWQREGEPVLGVPVLGLLLGVGIVFSYWHMLTSLAIAVLFLWPRGDLKLRARIFQLAGVAIPAGIVLLLWFVFAVPFFAEGLMVRDGMLLHHTLPRLFLVRLDEILQHLPGAWVGEHLEHTNLRLAAGIALSILTVGAARAAWRLGGELRWPVVMLAVCFPALSVGQALLEPPQVYRYYIPLLCLSILLIAAWDWRAMLFAVLCSMSFWFPSGLEMPGQTPERSHMELGGNAFHRHDRNPHIKYNTYREVVAPAYRHWFAFGYGLDSGIRYEPTRTSMTEGVWESGATVEDIESNPQLSLYRAATWIAVDGDPKGDLPFFFRGMGVGFGADGRIGPLEGELLAKVSTEQRGQLMVGLGATLGQMLLAGTVPAQWAQGLGLPPTTADWESLAKGAVAVGASDAVLGGIPGSELKPEELAAIQRGLSGPPADDLTAMMAIPMVRTPLPPPPKVFEVTPKGPTDPSYVAPQ